MQRAKLFGALFAYVNNIQITWKMIHLSVFCRTNSPSTDQSRAEGNNTEVDKYLIQNVGHWYHWFLLTFLSPQL